jgi:serine/threonine protein kinase
MLAKPTLLNSDLKPENILVGLEKTFSLDCVVQDEIDSPSPRKYLLDRTIYLSHNDCGHPKSTPGRPKISDFDSAVRVTASQNTFTHPSGIINFFHTCSFQNFNFASRSIQPNCYRAPEVILGAQWSYPVDVWNLSVMVHLVFPFGFSSLLTMKNLHTALGSPGGHCSL